MSNTTTNNADLTTSYLRVATFSIALFDFAQTIPGEYRLYRKQRENGRISLICVLFIICRYFSVICLVVNGIGFWYTHFTPEQCKYFYLAPPMTKLVAGLACEGIIFVRTYAISHNRATLYGLGALAVLLFPLQVIGNTLKRHPVVGTGFELGNCTAKRFAGDFNSAPYYYLANVIFDTVACVIATGSLLRRKSVNGNLNVFTRKVLKHGVLFAIGATITNFFVMLALFEVPKIKTLGAFLSVAIIQILATHLVLETAGTKSSSQEDSSSQWSNTNKDRSRSRSHDPSGGRRTIGGTVVVNGGMTKGSTRFVTSQPGDFIEMGGIRVETQTETDYPRNGHPPEKSKLSTPDSSTDDLSYSDRYAAKGEREINVLGSHAV